jgi:hypothetical protein
MTTTIGSGLGGFAAIAPQPTYGAAFVTPTRTLAVKSAKMDYNPHPVQGGPYLAGGRTVDVGSARQLIWLDANGNLSGDVTSSAHALLLATALGTPSALSAIGATVAYGLNGAGPANYGNPDANNGAASGGQFDMQIGVPTSDGTLRPENYHSCMITKAEWVFDRSGYCTFSYDIDAQYVEKTTALIVPTYPAAPAPFSMAAAASAFRAGALGAEVAIDGVRKATVTLTRGMANDRIYLGNQYKDVPVTNALSKLEVSLDVDYTVAAKTGLFDLFLAGTPVSLLCTAVGAQIGATVSNATFGLNVTNAFADSGGSSPLDGPDMVKNTIAWSGTINAAGGSPLTATLLTADTTF